MIYNYPLLFYEQYILLERSINMESFITFFTYFLLLNTLIPISLIITMEIVKITQGILTFTTSLFILAKRLPENSRLKELRDTLFNFSFNEYLRLAVIFSHTLAIIWTTAILSEYPKI